MGWWILIVGVEEMMSLSMLHFVVRNVRYGVWIGSLRIGVRNIVELVCCRIDSIIDY